MLSLLDDDDDDDDNNNNNNNLHPNTNAKICNSWHMFNCKKLFKP